MLKKPGRETRDPRAKKAKDLSRQRKIATNSSDKAARKNAPLRKAMANRAIRRVDKHGLDADHDASADHLRLAHARKWRSWGSELAADRRDHRRKAQKHFQENGGRKAVQAKAWAAFARRLMKRPPEGDPDA